MKKFKHKKTGYIAELSSNKDNYNIIENNECIGFFPKWTIEDSEDWMEINDDLFDYKSIKTFEDACKRLNIDPNDLPMLPNTLTNENDKLIKFYKLVIIFKAINDGWIPDYSNDKEEKYYPWFEWNMSSGFSFSFSYYFYSASIVGSLLLVTNSEEKSDYIGKTFNQYYK